MNDIMNLGIDEHRFEIMHSYKVTGIDGYKEVNDARMLLLVVHDASNKEIFDFAKYISVLINTPFAHRFAFMDIMQIASRSFDRNMDTYGSLIKKEISDEFDEMSSFIYEGDESLIIAGFEDIKSSRIRHLCINAMKSKLNNSIQCANFKWPPILAVVTPKIAKELAKEISVCVYDEIEIKQIK